MFAAAPPVIEFVLVVSGIATLFPVVFDSQATRISSDIITSAISPFFILRFAIVVVFKDFGFGVITCVFVFCASLFVLPA